MKYIPGITFYIGRNAPTRPARGGSILQQRTAISRPAETGNFKLDNKYVLERIRPVENKFEYHFVNQTTGQTFMESFATTIEADKMLDKFMSL